MPQDMSIRIPLERGEQLREFARLQSLGIGEAIGSLLEHAVTAGLVHELPMPEIDIEATSASVCLKVGAALPVYLSVAQAVALADTLLKVSTIPGAAHLDLDGPHVVEVCRRGRAVVLSIANSDAKDNRTYGRHNLFFRAF